MNKVILIGRLGADPETRTFDNGNKVANFTLATSERYKNREGEKVEQTEWHRISVFGKVADVIEQYCHKGDQLAIEGKIKTRKFESNGETKYITEVIVDIAGKVELLGKAKSDTASDAGQSDNAESATETKSAKQDDLPF